MKPTTATKLPAEGDALPDNATLLAMLRERAAAKRAAGIYTVDELAPGPRSYAEPIQVRELHRLREMMSRQIDLAVTPSPRPAVGRVVTSVKRILVQGTAEPLVRADAQSREVDTALLRYVAALGRELALLRQEVEELRLRFEHDQRS